MTGGSPSGSPSALPPTGWLPGPGAPVQERRGQANQAGGTEPCLRLGGTKFLQAIVLLDGVAPLPVTGVPVGAGCSQGGLDLSIFCIERFPALEKSRDVGPHPNMALKIGGRSQQWPQFLSCQRRIVPN